MNTPVVTEAIDRYPLTVAPETPLLDAIALMSQKQDKFQARSSCILVMEDSKIVGIFTERDVVGLTAKNRQLSEIEIGAVMTQPVLTMSETNFQDIFAALFLFRRYRIRHLPILDEQERLVGVVSPETIRQTIKPANLLKLRRVSEVMSRQIIHAPPTTSIFALAQLMAQARVSCVVITQEIDGEFPLPIGIVTEKDIVQLQSLNLNVSQTYAGEIMSAPLFLLSPEDSLWTAHQEMQKRYVRRLVVSGNWGRDLGIVTQTSLLRIFDPMEMYNVIETLQTTVEDLKAKKTSNCQKNGINSEQSIDLPHEWREILSKLQTHFHNLTNQANLPEESRQQEQQQALATVKQIQEIFSSTVSN